MQASGKEIRGILREYDVESHEALIENGQLILAGGKTSASAWYYIPSGEHIEYIRTIEEN